MAKKGGKKSTRAEVKVADWVRTKRCREVQKWRGRFSQ